MSRVIQSLPVKVGDSLDSSTFADRTEAIERSIESTIHLRPTDIGLAFYDEHGKAIMFIGIPGPTVVQTSFNHDPFTDATLPENGFALYQSFMDALSHAKASSLRNEDDSKGYAVFADPELGALQIAMRTYALSHVEGIYRGLGSRQAQVREASADLLGYAESSPKQIRALAHSMFDPDESTRNNAIRALKVLVGWNPRFSSQVPADRLIGLLSSGIWTDRNKGVSLVMAITSTRPKRLLQAIKGRSLSSLEEMARWTNPLHARSAQIILGRIAGFTDEKTLQLCKDGRVEEVIAAAQA